MKCPDSASNTCDREIVKFVWWLDVSNDHWAREIETSLSEN